MTDKEWDDYVNTGEVSIDVLKDLVNRIKTGQKLDVKDLSVYNSYAKIIEILLKKS